MTTTFPEKHTAVLRVLHDALSGKDLIWAITGSTSFALQGMPLTPNDIDLQTDEPGAYAIAALFPAAVMVPVRFSESEKIRSHFGKLEMDGLRVELMGALQKRLPDDTWELPVDVKKLRIEVAYAGMTLPVLPLEYEYQAYLKLGRLERAKQIRAFLDDENR